MPGYVSLKELIDFTKKNYIHNIWNQGISELYNNLKIGLELYEIEKK